MFDATKPSRLRRNHMPQYIFTFRAPKDDGAEPSTRRPDAWSAFFERLGAAMVDVGNPVFTRTKLGRIGSETVLGGYSIVAADDLDAALELAAECPFLRDGGGVEVGELTILNPRAGTTFDIRHRVGIVAPVAAVYEALATPQGIAGWWARDVTGDTAVGGKLTVAMKGPDPLVMEILELAPDERVTWRCIQGPDEWVGTTQDFVLHRSDDETTLVFTHAGWREHGEFMHHCSTKWAQFLIGLKAGLEGGRATPYPEDSPISSWS
jgi:uncharacterized protein YndB with AHSA1/START domain